MSEQAQVSTVAQDWEVWPSMSIEIGRLLHRYAPEGAHPVIDLDIGAAEQALRDSSESDSQPGIVSMELRVGPIKKPLLNRKLVGFGRAHPASKKEKRSQPNHVARVGVSITDESDSFDSLMSQIISIHELDHAAKFASPTAMKAEKRFRLRTVASYTAPMVGAEALWSVAPQNETVYLAGLALLGSGLWRFVKRLPLHMASKSPLEQSAYGTMPRAVIGLEAPVITCEFDGEQVLAFGPIKNQE